MKKALLLPLLVFCTHFVWAHALWIETNPVGQKNQQQDIKVYFGEYADNDLSPADKWFSDLKNFTLVVIAPDGKSQKLSTTASGDHYKSSFIPDQEGVYTVTLYHPVKDFYHGMQLRYNSSATVKIGNAVTGNVETANKNPLSIFAKEATTGAKDKTVNLKVLIDGKAAAQKEVKIFAPNGWSKTLYTNENGEVDFVPLWSGKYQAEISQTDATPGEHEGKKYDKIFNAATCMLFIK
ncbi:MAG: DUF4198 domain-containing protein [Niabella sp.]